MSDTNKFFSVVSFLWTSAQADMLLLELCDTSRVLSLSSQSDSLTLRWKN